MRAAALLVAAVLAASPAALAQATLVEAPAEEIVVEGVQPGPRMWVVEDSDSEVWILGTNRYLPKKVRWETSAVERLLARADAVITRVDVKVSPFRVIDILFTDRDLFLLPKGQTLEQALAPDLHARLQAARGALELKADKFERLRPAIAGAALLGEALDRAELDGRPPEEQVIRLANRRNIKVRPLRTYKGREVFRGLQQISPAAERACLAATLAMIEQGMPALRAYADAWARGDVAYLRGHPPPEEFEACEQELTESVEFFRRAEAEVGAAYLQEVAQGLAAPGVRLILLAIDEAISPQTGLIDKLRAQGYAVEGP